MQRTSIVCPVQVGREAETAAIREAVAGVRGSGDGRLVMLGGAAGVGKTRVTSETVRWAAAQGMPVLEGHSTADAGAPYAAFVTALRRRTRTLDDDRLAALFKGTAGPAAALLPELGGMIEAAKADQDALFAGVWQVLHRLAGPDGALLVLEDVHWADADSLRLLDYLAHEVSDLPVCILANYRTDELHRRHPLELLLAELGRERRYIDVRLRPLDLELVRAMLSAIFDGAPVGDEFARAVLERTDGNPFFVEELMKVLVERGDVYLSDGEWERRELAEIELPVSVRESLLARARTMPEGDLEILELAALAGVEFEPQVLAAASERTIDEIDGVVQRALQLQFLAERREGATTTYAFRHALSREAFSDELFGPQRRRAHLVLAEAIKRVHAGVMDTYAPVVADHLEAAGESAEAAEYALLAARAAAAAFAPDEADRRFDQALRGRPAPDADRLALLLEASEVSAPTQVTRMQAAFAADAMKLARSLGDLQSEVRALLVLDQERWLAGDGTAAIQRMEEARELVHGKDPYLEATILRRLTRLLALADRSDDAERLLPEAIALAETTKNLSALSGMHATRMLYGDYATAFWPNFEAALRAARSSSDPAAEGNLKTNGGFIALWNCDFKTSEQMLQGAVELFERLAPHERYAHAGLGWLRALRAEYEEALALAGPVQSGFPRPTMVVALTALGEVALLRGDADVDRISAELLELSTNMGENQRAVPGLALECRRLLASGELDQGMALADELLVRLDQTRTGSHWMFSPDVCFALAAEGRGAELAGLVERLDRKTQADPVLGNLTALALCRGYLANARGDHTDARTHLAEAVSRYDGMPAPARAAEARLALAEALVVSDPAAAAELVTAALDTAERIGAAPLTRRASALMERTTSRAVLATILFTDIVGSTEQAVRLGDLAWRDVIERHHAIVRRELARGGGREIDTAGDGFLAAFDIPAAAIRTAVSIRDALAATGIGIRAGIHTGECQESGGKLTGLTVHIAARVSSAAGDGDVLVSQTVRDLVAGSAFPFSDRGVRTLKGIPGEWRVFAVGAD